MPESTKPKSMIKSMGDIHEEAALNLMGGDAENLNHNPKLEGMGLRGGNYDTFDIFSSKEICSVKVRMHTKDGSPNLENYKSEFSRMLGYNKAYQKGLSPLEQDAQRIIECSKRGVAVPEQLKGADQEKVVSYLQQKSIMRVPSDHVEAFRNELIKDAEKLPQNYFLPNKPTKQDLQTLANRVQSTGLSATQSRQQLNAEKHSQSAKIDLSLSEPSSEKQEVISKNPDAKPNHEPSEKDDYDYGYGY
jgi:hypothetical protein